MPVRTAAGGMGSFRGSCRPAWTAGTDSQTSISTGGYTSVARGYSRRAKPEGRRGAEPMNAAPERPAAEWRDGRTLCELGAISAFALSAFLEIVWVS